MEPEVTDIAYTRVSSSKSLSPSPPASPPPVSSMKASQYIEQDARGIRIPWRDAGILEMIIEQGHAQFRDGGSPGRVDRVPVRGPEIQDRISRDVHMIRPHPRPNVRGRIPGRRLVPEKEIRVWQPEVGLEVVDQRRRTRRRTGQNRQDT